MTEDLRARLPISAESLEAVNALFLAPGTRVVDDLLAVVARYGTPESINAQAAEAGRLDNLLEKVRQTRPEYLDDLNWLIEQRDRGAFISVDAYRRQRLGEKAAGMTFAEDYAVTLEVSALQYFPWLRPMCERAIAEGSLVPGRFIRVRKMKEQEADGDLPAVAAAMQIIGASWVETLDTKGTDGSNIHLGGPETITGYFGGVGQPDEHALQWVDEFLYYYTRYGVREVLNINPGTVLLGYMLYKLGVDIRFKISVFMGNDNPYAALWTLIGARLFAREDGSTPLIGFNWSNSVHNPTLEITDQVRAMLGFTEAIRFEHHITETWKSIVIQPYDRRAELVELADHVANISAKHEGGLPEVEVTREHPSDILDYFRDKEEVIAAGDWEAMQQNFLDKVAAANSTAQMLTEKGLAFIAAQNLHR